jgi:hypothetical protein
MIILSCLPIDSDWTQWTSDELFRDPGVDLFSYDQDMIAQQSLSPGVNEVSTPSLAPAFSEHPALDVEALNQIRYEEGHDRRAALDPKEAFSSWNLASSWEQLPTSQAVRDYQPRSTNGQQENSLPEPVSPTSQLNDRPNIHAQQSTPPSRPPSRFEQPQQPMSYSQEDSMSCEHAQCSDLTFDDLLDWK